mmetsp:Transcript_41637/g.114860  ORF Transcript_41637/g.114860 Transcript_41637/m.114860 type:complete len:382 (-) Transcript_41637:804-1949(-)
MGSWPRELAKIGSVRVTTPDGLRPESSPVHVVLQIVADNVRLLQEQAHGVCDGQIQRILGGVRTERPHALALASEASAFCTLRHKDTREAHAHETGDHMAITVVCSLVRRALRQIRGDVLGHARAHHVGDVPDDFPGTLAEALHNAHDRAELLQQDALVSCAYAVHAASAVLEAYSTEIPELHLLVRLPTFVGFHVVLHRIESPQHEVEHRDVDGKRIWQLPNDRREGARDLAQHCVDENDVRIVALHVSRQRAKELKTNRCRHLQRTRELIELGRGMRRDLAVRALLDLAGTVFCKRLPTADQANHQIIVLRIEHGLAPGRVAALLQCNALGRLRRVQVWSRGTRAAQKRPRRVEAVDRLRIHVFARRECSVQVLPPGVQ